MEIRQTKGKSYACPLPLVNIALSEDIKTIIAGKNGEYIPLYYYRTTNPESLIKKVEGTIKNDGIWDVSFSGNFFANKQMLNELVVILLISVLLMYFILSSQFENFLQPLLILAEIPIDIVFTLIVLWMTGNSLNLMSAIGIVVSTGIVINDSILKIDLINQLRKEGVPLMEAIHTAGETFTCNLMTSLTSIFAMIPILFTFDIGSELQKPLAVAMISAMTIGTLVSLFVIPLFYWKIYNKEDKEKYTIR